MRYSSVEPGELRLHRLLVEGLQREPAVGDVRRADARRAPSRSDVDGRYTGFACGLSIVSRPVTPASFRTLTRNARQPCSTSRAGAAPRAIETRLSGLMRTSTRQRGASSRSMAAAIFAASAESSAARRSAQLGVRERLAQMGHGVDEAADLGEERLQLPRPCRVDREQPQQSQRPPDRRQPRGAAQQAATTSSKGATGIIGVAGVAEGLNSEGRRNGVHSIGLRFSGSPC